jgi:predicted porin
MKKTLVALAALSAISAFAQTTVTLTGRASMDVSTYSATGSTAGEAQDFKNRTRVADTSSRIAFGVNEDLGGGLKAGVYCETGINIDNASANGQAATPNANTSEWCSREGRAYFGNATAEVRLGRQNVWWTQGALNEVGSTYLGSDSFTNLQNGGVGVYTVRGENMIKLVSGAATGAFAGSEIYTGSMNGTGEGTGVNATPKGMYRGFKLNYTQGQLVAMWDNQSSTSPAIGAPTAGVVVGANSFDRKANKVGVGFKYMPDSIVTLQYWKKSRTDVTTPGGAFVSPFMLNAGAQTTTGDAKDSGYGIVVKHALTGTLTAHAQYGKANKLKNDAGTVDNTGATSYTLGLTQAMSKRTHFYTAYHKINNQSAAAYNMVGGNYASGTSRQGADVKMLAIGMIHNF